MIIIPIVAIYLFTCWLASRIFIDAWRFEFDVTREDQAFLRAMSFMGPVSLALAVFVWFEGRSTYRSLNSKRNNDIIYPRKEKS